MDGSQFLTCAKDLATGTRPDQIRSAISRAYYAAFHVARSWINGYGIKFRVSEYGKEGPHKLVVDCLRTCPNRAVKKLGQQLLDLRTTRNTADYDLGPGYEHVERAATAQKNILVAESIVGVLQKIKLDDSDKHHFRQNVGAVSTLIHVDGE